MGYTNSPNNIWYCSKVFLMNTYPHVVERCENCGGNLVPVEEHKMATILKCVTCGHKREVYYK